MDGIGAAFFVLCLAVRSETTKRLLRVALRLLGVGLVVFVLTRIQLDDSVSWPDGRTQEGSIVERTDDRVVFRPEDFSEAIDISTTGDGAPEVTAGVLTIIRGADGWLLLWAALAFGPITLISITRWWMLLRAVALPIRFLEALRLSYIGFFFNAVVPGLTGGDVIKAFYIARGSSEPYKAFLSVFVDRAIGLFGLALLAATVVTMHAGEPDFQQVSLLVYGVLALATAAGCVIFSRRLRRWLRVEQILARLPFGGILTRIDQAITIYRNAPGAIFVAVLMSIGNHVGIVAMVVLIGRALGIDNPVSHFFAIAPLCFIVASVPLVPGGWGMREGAFAFFFATVGVAPELSVPTSVLLGLAQLAWFLLGGPVFIARPDRASTSDIQAFSAEMEAENSQPG
jgi:uncharacterized protein (TIRG00374 family)